MKELAPLMKNKEFINYIHAEAAKKFDGSNEVLIKTLISNPQFSKLINTQRMNAALAAFINIDGQNLYPQIYIPNFDKHLAKRNSPTYRTSAAGDELVIYDGTEPQTTAPSYIYNEEGEIIPTGTVVTEQYALDNEIYIISINENVQYDGTFPPEIMPIRLPPQITSNVNFRIERIWVKDNKESWLAGASEVHIKALSATYNHRIAGNPLDAFVDYPTNPSVSPYDYKGRGIIQLPRNEVTSSGIPYIVDYPLNVNWVVGNYYSDPIAFCYVIFEYDPWPAGIKGAVSLLPSSPDPTSDRSSISFRSSNTSYGGEVSGFASNVNKAIYGNVSGLSLLFRNLYFDNYYFQSPSLDFTTVKY